MTRRATRQIQVGTVPIGGDAPITVQQMATICTRDVQATVAQIHRLEEVGCKLVRVACPEEVDVQVLGTIFSQLLGDGIGDTIRVSLTAEPEEEIPVAYEILRALELRQRGVTFVSCPSCGRVEIDVLAIANEVEKRLSRVQTPIQVAVMGCVVNGPGESRDADVGLARGRGKGVIYRKGLVVKTAPESDFLVEVLKEIANLLPPHEARLIYPGDGSPGTVSLGRTRKSGIHQSTAQHSTESGGGTGGFRGVPLPMLSQREVL